MTPLEHLARSPRAFDFFQAVRTLENAHPGFARVGRSLRLRDDPFRLAQSTSLEFAVSTVSAYEPARGTDVAALAVNFFGLCGPNGPLPIHLGELVRERSRRVPPDHTLAHFLDIFHHRLLCLLYRAWAESSPAVCHDRPAEDPFGRWVASLAGDGHAPRRGQDPGLDVRRQAVAGLLAHQVRSAEGLQRVLEFQVGAPIAIRPWHEKWLSLDESSRSRLGHPDNALLGAGVHLGRRVRDCQGHVLVEIGPLGLAAFQELQPGERAGIEMRHWVVTYLGRDVAAEIRLILAADAVPALALGRVGRLGRCAWLCTPRRERDADDRVFAVD